MNTERLLEEVEKLLEPVLKDLGLELVEREFVPAQGRFVLRLYIDREASPVTLDDCEKASKAIEGILDVEDLIPYSYVLEISSPGVNRPLRKEKDFERFLGSFVDVKSKEMIEGRHHFSGILTGIKAGKIALREGEREWLIPLGSLKKARVKRLDHGLGTMDQGPKTKRKEKRRIEL